MCIRDRNLDRVSENYSKEAKILSDKYDGRPINKDNFDVNQVIDYSSAYVSYITKCIEEINAVFGDNTDVYKRQVWRRIMRCRNEGIKESF